MCGGRGCFFIEVFIELVAGEFVGGNLLWSCAQAFSDKHRFHFFKFRSAKFASCFRASPGSGMGDPKQSCPTLKYKF